MNFFSFAWTFHILSSWIVVKLDFKDKFQIFFRKLNSYNIDKMNIFIWKGDWNVFDISKIYFANTFGKVSLNETKKIRDKMCISSELPFKIFPQWIYFLANLTYFAYIFNLIKVWRDQILFFSSRSHPSKLNLAFSGSDWWSPQEAEVY
jgi:hypothetical protein